MILVGYSTVLVRLLVPLRLYHIPHCERMLLEKTLSRFCDSSFTDNAEVMKFIFINDEWNKPGRVVYDHVLRHLCASKHVKGLVYCIFEFEEQICNSGIPSCSINLKELFRRGDDNLVELISSIIKSQVNEFLVANNLQAQDCMLLFDTIPMFDCNTSLLSHIYHEYDFLMFLSTVHSDCLSQQTCFQLQELSSLWIEIADYQTKYQISLNLQTRSPLQSETIQYSIASSGALSYNPSKTILNTSTKSSTIHGSLPFNLELTQEQNQARQDISLPFVHTMDLSANLPRSDEIDEDDESEDSEDSEDPDDDLDL